MVLSDEQIRELAEDGLFLGSIYGITRAIESEVRKDDEALIRQMLDALENSSPHTDRSFAWKDEKWQNQRTAAIAATRARLEQPCAYRTTQL
jgi:hypothetical protein